MSAPSNLFAALVFLFKNSRLKKTEVSPNIGKLFELNISFRSALFIVPAILLIIHWFFEDRAAERQMENGFKYTSPYSVSPISFTN